jgi:hypothetical protein
MSVYAITCPNCGGALEAIGGSRQVKTLTCKYCGSVLDIENEYRVLSQFKKVPLPDSPFRIGMRGSIKGVEFTIIGMVAYSCVKGVSIGEDTWIDFMLHSPTHGYAWLSYEGGNVIFSRQTRKLPSSNLLLLNPKDKFKFDGESYQFYEYYRAYVTYVQGELTYIAKKDDLIHIYDAINPPFGLTLERSYGELSYSISEYLDTQEVYKSFDIKSEPVKYPSFNPLKPFSSPKLKAFSYTSAFFAVVTFILMVVLSISFNGKLVKESSFSGKMAQIPFHIDDTSHLVQIDIEANVDNSWVYYDISVIDSENEEIYSIGKEISYYHGYEGGESWSEGSTDESAYIKLDKAGDYTLLFIAPENPSGVYTHVKIRENVIRVIYFQILFVMFLLFSLLYLIKLGLHHTRLWKHVQEEDED